VVTLADVAGMADLKHLVRREIVDPIRYPEIDDVLNIPYGFGVLLYGPPGTGKTYFARALVLRHPRPL
jgi:ATP-dependent 26S proteasome regulatory subunit